jgi:U6 snRNA-associated Sm-like protein LSm1
MVEHLLLFYEVLINSVCEELNNKKDRNERFFLLGNLVLHQAFERICVGRQYADIPRGLFVIRGENVLLIGELDFHQPLRVPLVEVTIEEILKLQKEDLEKKERIEKLRQKAMIEHGLIDEGNPIEEHY